MKKTIPTTIAGTLFYIEEDAYARLSTYLDSVKAHFASHAEHAEIISDIESRVAEQFAEKNSGSSAEKIVSLADVEKLITTMGNVGDFDDTEKSGATGASAGSNDARAEAKHKKLFRNPDDVVVAGVASGIAAYFNLDPIIVRLLFVLVVLIGGSGVLIYIILWIIIPVAKTSADKLQMRGDAVTLESLNHMVREKVDEVKKNKGTFRKIISIPFVILGKILGALGPVLRKLIGLLLVVISSILIFGLIFFTAVVVFNTSSPYVDSPFVHMGHPLALVLALFAGLLAVIIPLLFVFFLGTRILKKVSVITSRTGLSLLGLWCIALISLGVTLTRVVPEYRNFVETSPLYAQTTREFPLSDFTGVSAEDASSVTVVEGPVFSVRATGRAQDVSDLSVLVENGVLNVGRDRHFKICVFCMTSRPEVVVTLPHLASLNALNGARLSATATSTEELSVSLQNGARLELQVETKLLRVDTSNASYAALTGTSTSLSLTLSNASHVAGKELHAESADVQAENASRAEVWVEKSLTADARNASRVLYSGNPTVQKTEQNGSSVREANTNGNENTWEDFQMY